MAELKKEQLGLYFVFFILVFSYMLFFFPSDYIHAPLEPLTLLSFFLISILLYSYPIRTGTSYTTLTIVVQLFIFLQYGLLAEIVLTQLTLFIAIFFAQEKWQIRHFFNHTIVLIASILGAAAYFLAFNIPFPTPALNEYIHGPAILSYLVVTFLAKQLLYHWTLSIRGYDDIPLFEWQSKKWLLYIMLLTAPLSVMLVAIYQTIGLLGALLASIPTLIVAYIFHLLNEIEQANEKLRIIHDLTSKFTTEIKMTENVHELLEAIRALHSYDTCYIMRLEANELYPFCYDGSSTEDRAQRLNLRIPVGGGITGYVAETKKPIMINQASDVIQPWIDKNRIPSFMKEHQSVLAVPLISREKVLGVVLLGKYKENGFSRKDLTMLEILAGYMASAIGNEEVFEQTERRALRDELTGLFNYRGFEMMLEKMMSNSKNTERGLALLILDIDLFKGVNDRFGHVMGNKVLAHVAETIKQNVRKDDIVSRYGGEEFTVILPNTSQEDAWEIAERLRQAVSNSPLKVVDDLDTKKEIYIRTTISVGLAVYPDQAEDSLTLLRNADRAMYVGAKQAGRNRVAIYEAG